jgi:hypothetical protein
MLRILSPNEEKRLRRLAAEGIDVALLQPTRTGLAKSILDATGPVRAFLLEKGIHDYGNQGQGASEHRMFVEALLLAADRQTVSRASLYRPRAKSGDPRIWFSGLPAFAEPDDIIAMACLDGRLGVFNLSRDDVDTVLEFQRRGPLWEFLQAASASARAPSIELLGMIREIAARGPLKSVMPGRSDTAVGRSLETHLGIKINSSKSPDYKGIEIKAFRRKRGGSRGNKRTLFAQVPDWRISKLKSSREILETFGYIRGGLRKLNCTVDSLKPNPQDLFLRVEGELLEECHATGGAFARWKMDALRSRLRHKHQETFWVAADVLERDGFEYFDFKEVTHTSKPIDSQFGTLIDQGHVFLDHLIEANENGGVTEKGPLFRIWSEAMPLLFAPPRKYTLC